MRQHTYHECAAFHITTSFPFLLPHRTCSLSRACALKEWKNNLVVIFVQRKERLSLYYLYVISILLLYYIYIIVRSFFASDTPYLRIFTPILTHLIDFLTHQVRIFCISRCQIHAPAFPSKTSFQHFITSALAYISHEPKIASLLREVARAQRVTEGVRARKAA
jgi:hypothetical protein